MKINILLPILFLLHGCTNDVKPFWLSGLWKGTFKDIHISDDLTNRFVDQPSYPAVLAYQVSTNTGEVFYPTLGCSSNWTYTKIQNDTLFFEEKVINEKNQAGCVDLIQYKVIKVSENEISVFGNGITSKGSKIETKGVLSKGLKTNAKYPKSYSVEQKKEKVQKVSIENNHSESLADNNISQSMPIVGIWRSDEITENYGIKSTLTIIWQFKSNFKSIFRVRARNGFKDGNISTWKMIGEKLQTTPDGINFEEYNIIWDDENFLGFTLETEGILNNRHFMKIPNNPFSNDINTTHNNSEQVNTTNKHFGCRFCDGSGYVSCATCGGSGEVIGIGYNKEVYNNGRIEYHWVQPYHRCSYCSNGKVKCINSQ